MLHGWLILLLSLPPRPSSLRVRAWRRLRALGAVPLKSGAYLLPDTGDRYEQFQWLAQEVQRDGGDATLLRVDRVENMQQPELVRLFQEVRNHEYTALAERYRKLLKGRRARPGAELARLARELARISDIDFFEAPGRREAERAREAVEQRTATGRARPAGAAPPLDLEALKGRRWVTRPRPHVDRVASAWLIKRFVDPEAEFVFAPPDQIPGDAIPFDMAGVDLGHQGEDCTFETLLRRAGLRDRKLVILAEIVHEADLKDDKFARAEAHGIDLALRGLLSAIKDDHEALAQGMTLFDGLYATIGERT
ncbi:MAG TPA: chromate resistance protein ChrB domain-containing protein [Candidatus Nitrosotalea sp.]|nr:chromate resistance protein ChrB domain-containing protein [Candidatus Nitrosotalea sp.]